MGKLFRALFGSSGATSSSPKPSELEGASPFSTAVPQRAPRTHRLSDMYLKYKDEFEKAREEEMRKLDQLAIKTRYRTGSVIFRLDNAVHESVKAQTVAKSSNGEEAPLEMPKELFEVLHSPLLRSAFRAYLKRKFAGESLAFFETIELFKKVDSEEWRVQVAEGMMTRFVLEGAEFGVNIGAADKSELWARMKTCYWPKDSFDAVQREMYELMNTNYFGSFCRTYWPGGVLLAVPGGPFAHENLIIDRANGSTADELGSSSTTGTDPSHA